MSPTNPAQVNELLRNAAPDSTVYLIGAGGCGVSGLGHLLLDLGFRVAGSDLAANEEIRQLRCRGAQIHLSHDPEHLRAARPVLAVYSSAIKPDNPELCAAREMKVPTVRRATLLAALMLGRRGICVAGMHGKTTTTALLAFALERLGAEPSYAVGSLVPQLERHARFSPQPSPVAGHPSPCPLPSPAGERAADLSRRSEAEAEGRVRGGSSAPPEERSASQPQLPAGLRAHSASQSRLDHRLPCPLSTTGEERVTEGRADAATEGLRPAFFVIEADESDGTLREFWPEHAIVLNVDAEHLDYYADLEAVCHEFRCFGEQTRRTLLFCADEPRLAELFARRSGPISYGFDPRATYHLKWPTMRAPFSIETTHRQGTTEHASGFEIWHHGRRLREFTTHLLGQKNVSNCAAVVALLHHLGFEPADIASAIAPFRGAARRQQELFADGRFQVFDDYAHHPREIVATIQAFRGLHPRRLLVAFQPHRYTRTRHLLKEFSTCFAGADRLWLTEVYAANEPEIPGVNGALLADAIRAAGQPAEFIKDLTELRRTMRAAMQPGDLVLFLGAGDITQAAHRLAADLRNDGATDKERFFAALSSALSAGSVLRQNEPLSKKTTLRVGGPADFYVEPASETDLAAVVKLCSRHQVPIAILGRGSNLLIKDGGIRGVVLSLAHPNFSRIEVAGKRLHCGAGARLKGIAVEARRHGLTGLEFLEGIPGSVGGGLRMNAGAMSSSMFEVVEAVRFMDYDGQLHERHAAELFVEYRGCSLFKSHIAVGAVLKGESAAKETIDRRMQTFSRKRWDTQPAASSAGCIFKNPKSIPAGKLIDELGLKGRRVGGAVVSDLHGNFIVNDGHATAQDVLLLIEIIKQRAKAVRGIDLETEVEIWGER